jgi:hypothetical protein
MRNKDSSLFYVGNTKLISTILNMIQTCICMNDYTKNQFHFLIADNILQNNDHSEVKELKRDDETE